MSNFLPKKISSIRICFLKEATVANVENCQFILSQTAFDKSCCPSVVMTVSYPVSEILLITANSLMSIKIQKP